MKFGGTSVADADCIKNVARRVVSRRQDGARVVVVVSAPAGMTDKLEGMARQLSELPSDREMDMLLSTGEQVSIALLCMALHTAGMDAVSLTGPQAGIQADQAHTRARITRIKPTKLFEALKRGKIVIVAGFQAINSLDDIVTLGRGGSDLSAVALAAALKADVCEIYTDVKGIYTADPRVVKEARKVDKISYDEMLELAGAGAKVMQARSIELGKKFSVPIHVRSSFVEEEGTLITGEVSPMEEVVVSGVAYDKNQAKVSLRDVPDRPGVASAIFGPLADQGINVDMIIQSAARDGQNEISFTISRSDTKKALVVLEKVKNDVKAKEVACDENVVKVSIVGVGMRSHAGVAAKLFRALAAEKINIEMISTSEIKVACVVKSGDGEKAVRLAHSTFGLERRRFPRPGKS